MNMGNNKKLHYKIYDRNITKTSILDLYIATNHNKVILDFYVIKL